MKKIIPLALITLLAASCESGKKLHYGNSNRPVKRGYGCVTTYGMSGY